MTLIDSLEHYYGALDENDHPRPIESPQPVDEPFDELENYGGNSVKENEQIITDTDYEDLEDDVDYGPTDEELEES